MQKASILGRGFAYPLRLDVTNSRVELSSEEQSVRESVESILMTDVDERPFVEKDGVPFGTRARRVVFESETVAVDIVEYEVRRALETWEPRIIVDSVDASIVDTGHGGVGIPCLVSWRYRSTNRDDNLVVPYMLARSSTPT